jgi:hypothetical protein
MLTPSQLRARAELLRATAAKARDPAIVAMLTEEAERLEAGSALREHGADKSSVDYIIGPPKPPANL